MKDYNNNNKVIYDYIEKQRDIETDNCSNSIISLPKIESDISKLETLIFLREIKLSTYLEQNLIKKDSEYIKYLKECKELNKFYNSRKSDIDTSISQICSLNNAMTHFKSNEDEESQ